MNFWKPIVAALVIFTAGILFGGILVGYGVKLNARQQAREKFPPRPPANVGTLNPANLPGKGEPSRPGNNNNPNIRQPGILAKDFVLRLDAEVHLTQGQHERITQILAEGQQRNKEIMERVTPDLRREMLETQRRIREILTDDQRVHFEELMKKGQNRREQTGQFPRPRKNPPSENRPPDPAPANKE